MRMLGSREILELFYFMVAPHKRRYSRADLRSELEEYHFLGTYEEDERYYEELSRAFDCHMYGPCESCLAAEEYRRESDSVIYEESGLLDSTAEPPLDMDGWPDPRDYCDDGE